MENAYGIGVKNRYELFYDEDVDPLEIIRQQEEEKEKRKTDKAHCKDKTKITKSGKPVTSTGLPKKAKENSTLNTPKPTELTETSNKPRSRVTERTSKNTRIFEDIKDVEDRKNFRNREDAPVSSDSRERDGGDARRGRGGFRGRGRPRGRGGGFNNLEGRPRREFDRHSGSDKTGVRPVEKKDGSGSNNWTDVKGEFSTGRRRDAEAAWDDDFDASGDKQNDSSWKDTLPETEVPNVSRAEVTVEKAGDDPITENTESKENEPISEERTAEEVKEMTLDEWKREQEAKRAVPKYNLRKPGEGEDNNQWKKLYMLKKKAKEDDDDEEEEDEEDVDDDEFARRGRQRQLVDIQINFNDSRRGRGRGRGVRGIGPRSGGSSVGNKDVPREERREAGTGPTVSGRGFSRGSTKIKSGQQSAPKVDDWNDFPSLVTA